MEDLIAIQGKSVAELREIAKVLGITEEKLSKKELIARISSIGLEDEQSNSNEEVAEVAPAPQKRKRARLGSVKVEAVKTTPVVVEKKEKVEVATEAPSTTVTEENIEEVAPQPKKRGRKPKSATVEVATHTEATDLTEPTDVEQQQRLNLRRRAKDLSQKMTSRQRSMARVFWRLFPMVTVSCARQTTTT